MVIPEITTDRSLIQTEEKMLTRWGEFDKPLVSINCITYNHEKYISDALDGFLIQKQIFHLKFWCMMMLQLMAVLILSGNMKKDIRISSSRSIRP